MSRVAVLAVAGAALVAIMSAPGVTAATLPLGIRNNNPGNIQYSVRNPWVGQIGKDARGYAVFATPADGIRAMVITLRTYANRYGIHTIRGIISKWAPKAGGNDTAAYIADVSQRMGIGPDQAFKVNTHMTALVRAIIWHENGQDPYTAAVIDNGIRMAA